MAKSGDAGLTSIHSNTTINDMKMMNHVLIQAVFGAIQIYVGLGFLELVPGFTASGLLGKFIGIVFLLSGVAKALSIFLRYRSKK